MHFKADQLGQDALQVLSAAIFYLYTSLGVQRMQVFCTVLLQSSDSGISDAQDAMQTQQAQTGAPRGYCNHACICDLDAPGQIEGLQLVTVGKCLHKHSATFRPTA